MISKEDSIGEDPYDVETEELHADGTPYGEVDVGSAPSVGQLGPEAPPRLGAAAAANTPVLPPLLACSLPCLLARESAQCPL